MARRGMTGQLNMFDLFQSLESPGEVEMVSLVPDFDEEPEVETTPEAETISEVEATLEIEITPEVEEVASMHVETSGSEKVAMSRCYVIDNENIEIAYINYNKVRITRGNHAPIVKEFASSKEAVDYYVEQMQEYEADE